MRALQKKMYLQEKDLYKLTEMLSENDKILVERYMRDREKDLRLSKTYIREPLYKTLEVRKSIIIHKLLRYNL